MSFKSRVKALLLDPRLHDLSRLILEYILERMEQGELPTRYDREFVDDIEKVLSI